MVRLEGGLDSALLLPQASRIRVKWAFPFLPPTSKRFLQAVRELCALFTGGSEKRWCPPFPLPWKFNYSVPLKSEITRKTSLSRLTQECSTHGLQPGCSWEWGSQGQTRLQPSPWARKLASTPGSLVQAQLYGTPARQWRGQRIQEVSSR